MRRFSFLQGILFMLAVLKMFSTFASGRVHSCVIFFLPFRVMPERLFVFTPIRAIMGTKIPGENGIYKISTT
jgi:hypothetical protein